MASGSTFYLSLKGDNNMTTEKKEVYCGIDVSKNNLDVKTNTWSRSSRFNNTKEGAEQISKIFNELQVSLVVIESTGGYETMLIKILQAAGLAVSLVNPRQTHAFAKSLGINAKTDSIDAGMLALYAEKITPRVLPKIEPDMEKLQSLNRRRAQLTDMLVQEKNRAKAPQVSAEEFASIKETKKLIRAQIRKIDALRDSCIQSSAKLKAFYQALDDEDGIAQQGACVLMGEIPELGELNRAQVAALVGVAPMNNDSGKLQGLRSIYGGRSKARSMLYMLTMAAIRRNEHIKSFYRRLVRSGKIKMVALVACMRKYLIYLNTKVAAAKLKLTTPLIK